MNKKLKMILAVVLLSGTSLYAADNLLGTKADPIVTKSYVDMKIAQIIKENGDAGNNTQLIAKVEAQEKQIASLIDQIEKIEAQKSTFEIVDVPAGKTIYGKQGSEMIIRSGEGRIVASLAGGVQDVTDGVDLAGDVAAPKNNLLIVPREDGRGIAANKPMTIMVRGGYTIL